MRRPTVLAAGLLLALGGPWLDAPASAHPHGYADTRVTFVLEQGKVTTIRIEWQFDQVYSAMLLDDADIDRDGRLDDGERAVAVEDWQFNLEEFGYFAHLTLDGAPVAPVEARDLDVSFHDGRGHLRYDVVVSPPADPVTAALAIGIYDTEFYLFVNPMATTPAAVAGDDGGRCAVRVVDDPERAYYFGQVIPKRYDLQCR